MILPKAPSSNGSIIASQSYLSIGKFYFFLHENSPSFSARDGWRKKKKDLINVHSLANLGIIFFTSHDQNKNIIRKYYKMEAFTVFCSPEMWELTSSQAAWVHSRNIPCSLEPSQSNFFAAGCKVMQHHVTNLYNIMQHYVIRGDISPHFRRLIAVSDRFCGDYLICI